MGIKAAIQALGKAELLKQRLLSCDPGDFVNPAMMALQKQLQQLYLRILIVDLPYALEKKVEQDLWSIGFKTGITALQDIIRDKKKSELSTMLSWSLSGASGFYITLLQETWGAHKSELKTNPGLVYLAQHCLVHLGDLARYQGNKIQAQSYYRHAIKISPFSGHAYNQLALLVTTGTPMGALKTAALYCRAAGAQQSFAPAHNNLMKLLDEYRTISIEDAAVPDQSEQTCILMFLQQLSSILNYTATCISANTAEIVVTLKEQHYKQMFALCLYGFKRILDTRICKDTELSIEEKLSQKCLLRLFVVYFHANNVDHPAFPTLYLILQWLQGYPGLYKLHELQDKSFWNNLVNLLNSFPDLLDDKVPDDGAYLPEEIEFLGFTSTETKTKICPISETIEKSVRVHRFLQLGLWLAKETDHLTVKTDGKGHYVFCTTEFDNLLSEPSIQMENSAEVSLETPTLRQEKPKGRTNVAMEGFLQKAAEKEAEKIVGTIFPDILDDNFITKREQPEPPLPPIAWIKPHTLIDTKIVPLPATSNFGLDFPSDENVSTVTSGFPNMNLLYDRSPGMETTSGVVGLKPLLFTGESIGNVSTWGPTSGAYSLFSGPSPLEKLLEEQKKHGTM